MNNQPYICKVHIENFRNFRRAEFWLNEKQVVIGENAVGKSNLLYALQLILDPTLSDKDRMLEESDFWEGLDDPMTNGEQILIELWFANFEGNKNVLAQLTDATVMLDEKEALKLTYKFYPYRKVGETNEYSFIIFKGDDENRRFSYDDRKFLNIRVIKAIRDVESEMRNSKTSPLTQIIKQKYTISKDVLAEISHALEEKGADTLKIGQVEDLESRIQKLLNQMVSFSQDQFGVSLKTINIDATKLLYALRPLIDNRESGNTSLGINNLLYIALILLLIEDETIKTYLPKELYEELIEKDESDLIESCYSEVEEINGYALNDNVLTNCEKRDELYDFMSETIPTANGVTILAVEEPEAHLHPIYQRLLYRHVMNRSSASVIITTHSTHISSVAPITSIVHLISKRNSTSVKTTARLELDDSDFSDLERYIDVKRGEIYLAKGVIFVEGVSEEYLIPSFAKAMGYEIDRLGIVVCNVNSTNFEPYRQFAESLGVPYIIVTDGDYYHRVEGKIKYGDLASEDDVGYGYAGIDRSTKFSGIADIIEAYVASEYEEGITFDDLEIEDQIEFFQIRGIFIGMHTFEVDIFCQCGSATTTEGQIICRVFDELTAGGLQQKQNFKDRMSNGEYNKCLAQIESSHSQIGKGRFSQRLSSYATRSMVPDYIEAAINKIIELVRSRTN
ncbi:putative ATP-dependent endonuclease of the OLD family [Desulfitobacterium dichloroeliminans LMG P-21439]|uniref:Putative ATP-dependent endonuclease of the OLD family n=1 Tax=Desulfitobacterium dichloroeliminans (strain LMG P-21439 / DCA1) TaxID=871963 RepID=L0F3P3_DESDL|nr:AAA family ATPase [Desulfitobacterium dichloroeliminans]AGA67685.1 putative ATP-dependent endonuclease of the OLD family [Desulfitobacterium dichloroeliminans LMG P-21439]